MSEETIDRFCERAMKDENPEHLRLALDCLEMVKTTYSKYEEMKDKMSEQYMKLLGESWNHNIEG